MTVLVDVCAQVALAVAHVVHLRQTVQLAQQMHNAHTYLAHARLISAQVGVFRIIARTTHIA
jgi:hypothetical protein